jgi:hypothetical protein
VRTSTPKASDRGQLEGRPPSSIMFILAQGDQNLAILCHRDIQPIPAVLSLVL